MKRPTLDEFVEHGQLRLGIMGKNPDHYKTALIKKFLAWEDNDWFTMGKKPREIKNWKSTLTNSLDYLKAEATEKPIMLTDKMKQDFNIN